MKEMHLFSEGIPVFIKGIHLVETIFWFLLDFFIQNIG